MAERSGAPLVGSLVEHPERPQVVNITTYYLRNQDVVDAADELLAFPVNASAGTKDTVDKARLKGIPVAVFRRPLVRRRLETQGSEPLATADSHMVSRSDSSLIRSLIRVRRPFGAYR